MEFTVYSLRLTVQEKRKDYTEDTENAEGTEKSGEERSEPQR